MWLTTCLGRPSLTRGIHHSTFDPPGNHLGNVCVTLWLTLKLLIIEMIPAVLRSRNGMNTKTQQVQQLPANTAPVQNLLRDRIRREPEFTGLMLEEVVECLLKNDVITAQLMLRDITNCTIGFKALAQATGIMEKSLMRMLSVKGNPQAKNLFRIIYSLQQLNEVRLEIRAV